MGCYGGGVLRGAPTPRVDKMAHTDTHPASAQCTVRCPRPPLSPYPARTGGQSHRVKAQAPGRVPTGARARIVPGSTTRQAAALPPTRLEHVFSGTQAYSCYSCIRSRRSDASRARRCSRSTAVPARSWACLAAYRSCRLGSHLGAASRALSAASKGSLSASTASSAGARACWVSPRSRCHRGPPTLYQVVSGSPR